MNATGTNIAFSCMIRRTVSKLQLGGSQNRRMLSFSFSGPRKLDELIKKEKMDDLDKTAVVALWTGYHHEKEGVLGLTLRGDEGISVLDRASESSFFIQPVFREDGYFNLVSQFQKPYHFLLAYLEDYKMDPSAASPLLTFSVFDDYARTKDLSLVRVDIQNKSISKEEGSKIVRSVLANYVNDYEAVRTFNKTPGSFDIDDFISRMNDRWKQEVPVDATTEKE